MVIATTRTLSIFPYEHVLSQKETHWAGVRLSPGCAHCGVTYWGRSCASTWQEVWKDRGAIPSPIGALCTLYLASKWGDGRRLRLVS